MMGDIGGNTWLQKWNESQPKYKIATANSGRLSVFSYKS